MSDVINSIFGRSKYDAPRPGDYTGAPTYAQPAADPADVAINDETVDTKAIEDEVTEPATATDSAETDVEAAETDAAEDLDADTEVDDVVEGDLAEGDVAEDDEATEDTEDTEDESDEPAAADDTAEDAEDDSDEDAAEDAADLADEDGEAEPVATESDDAPVATEVDVDDSDQAEPVAESVVEPVVESAESRPAAGTRGSTTVGDGVVTKIVNLVARKAEGVHDLSDEGISVEVDGDVATIKVSLVVEFGHAVNPVAEQVRVNVVEAVEQFLGLDVAVVDVHVTDIHIPDAV